MIVHSGSFIRSSWSDSTILWCELPFGKVQVLFLTVWKTMFTSILVMKKHSLSGLSKLVAPLSKSKGLLAELREDLLKSDNDLVNLHHNSCIRRESKDLGLEMQPWYLTVDSGFVARYTKKAIHYGRGWQCHCLFCIYCKDKNKIVPNGGKTDAFHRLHGISILKMGNTLSPDSNSCIYLGPLI